MCRHHGRKNPEIVKGIDVCNYLIVPYEVSPNFGALGQRTGASAPVIWAAQIKADQFRSTHLKFCNNFLIQRYFD